MTDDPSLDKVALLERIAGEWRALRRAFHDLDEAELVRAGSEGWSIKDHIAHVRAWERVALVRDIEGGSFAEAAEMDAAAGTATEGMTAEGGLNDYFVERDRALSLEAVLEASSALHAELMTALEALPEARLAGGELAPRVADNTYEHYAEHRAIIEALRRATS